MLSSPPPPHTHKNVKNILKSIETQIQKSLGCRTAGMQGSYICTWYKNTPNVCVLQQKQREKLQSKQLHGYKKKKSNKFFLKNSKFGLKINTRLCSVASSPFRSWIQSASENTWSDIFKYATASVFPILIYVVARFVIQPIN